MSITLPPLPERNPRSYKWTEREKQELRARDIEVARLVLDAAAQKARHSSEWLADAIRKMEVRHHE